MAAGETGSSAADAGAATAADSVPGNAGGAAGSSNAGAGAAAAADSAPGGASGADGGDDGDGGAGETKQRKRKRSGKRPATHNHRDAAKRAAAAASEARPAGSG